MVKRVADPIKNFMALVENLKVSYLIYKDYEGSRSSKLRTVGKLLLSASIIIVCLFLVKTRTSRRGDEKDAAEMIDSVQKDLASIFT